MGTRERGRGRPPRRRLRALLGVLIVALLLAGGVAVLVRTDTIDPAGVIGQESGAFVEGVVIDGESEEGIEGAVVRIDHAGGEATVETDADGRFRAEVDPSRPIALTADAPGHLGVVAFGKLCPDERLEVRLALPPAGSSQTPPAPIVLSGRCG